VATGMSRPTYRFLLLLALLTLGLGAEGRAQSGRPGPVRVVINEILASNRSSITDPQAQHADWIELYNPLGTTADVGGCYLTDDLSRPTKWQIPTGIPALTTIAAHGYLLVWADGDIADPGLHAAFKLNDEGEEVALFAPDGVTLLDRLSFGPQRVDVSYGRYPDGGAELRFMPFPSPGAANNGMYEGIVATPQMSVAGRLCLEPITISLTTATEGATIYYTTDGSSPLGNERNVPVGKIYTGPINVTRTTTIRAYATRTGWAPSDVHTERYVFIGPDLQTFSSPLPIAVIDTYGKGIGGSPVSSYSFFIDLGADGRAALTGAVDSGGPAAIKVRGQSSAGFPKKQYHLETQDEQGHEQDVSILGFPAESDWVLQGMYSDKTLMRNALAYQWSNELGQWATHTRFIEMFLNTDNSALTMSDYVGVYVFMEKIKIAPNRVDIAELEPSDNAEPQITGGYIIKKDKLDGDDVTFNTNRGLQLVYMDPNGRVLTQPQKDYIRNYVNAFEAALYGPSFRDPTVGYAKYIDVDSFIDNHIVVELTKNIDGFRLSTYFHKDRNGKLVMGPVWDYDLSLGNADYLNGWIPTGWYNVQLGEGDYPYWRRMFEDPEFRLRYADRWFAVRRDLFSTARLVGIISDYAALLDEPAQRNFDKWRILGTYVWPNPTNVDAAYRAVKTYAGEVAWMTDWLRKRLVWMDSQIAAEFAPAPPVFSRQGGHVDPGFTLQMDAAMPIYYTLDGSDPRLFTGPIVPMVITTLLPESAPKVVLVPDGPVLDTWRGGSGRFGDSAWTPITSGPGGVGFERGVVYGSFISLDVRDRMYNLQTSCLVRVPFVFARDIGKLNRLTLRVRYDDAFVAWLNGVEIARRNFTGDPVWNSAAETVQAKEQGVNFEDFDVPNFRNLLHTGNNLLALHALTRSVTTSDFLISAEITAEEFVDPPAILQIHQYTAPVTLTKTQRVLARTLTTSGWSALNEAVFAVGPVAESLRVSEIMYHPADTGDPNDPNTEYLELTNIGAEAIDLNLVRCTDGIEFTFPSFELPPAGYCLLVKDEAAFESRYGPHLPVAGRYAGSLSNAGERITLQDAAGRLIQSFEFRDGWYDSTDGGGYSLTVRNPAAADPNALDSKAGWRPSTVAGGSPGAADAP
jgi:hypothetical protein